MDIRDLQVFLAVTKRLNFTRAGEDVHLSQPSVSERIRQLERELGVKLFEQATPKYRCRQQSQANQNLADPRRHQSKIIPSSGTTTYPQSHPLLFSRVLFLEITKVFILWTSSRGNLLGLTIVILEQFISPMIRRVLTYMRKGRTFSKRFRQQSASFSNNQMSIPAQMIIVTGRKP